MVAVAFMPPTAAHVAELVLTMRDADAAECFALGSSPFIALEASLARADVKTALLFDGQVAAILGARDTVDGRLGWLLTSALVSRYPMTFWRLCRPTLRALRGDAPRLFNWVDARYETSLRWLRHLGFTIHPPAPLGPLGMQFHLCEVT